MLASGPAGAADLLEIYRLGQAHDAQYAAARAERLAAEERIPQGRAGLMPSVGLNASTAYNDADIVQPASGNQSYNTNSYSLQLTQPLFRWQNLVQFDQAKLAVAQAEAAFSGAGQELALRVVQAYFDVLYAQDVLAFTQAQKTAIVQQLEQARRNFEVGTATIVDTHEAQARHDLAVSQEIAAQNDLAVKQQSLTSIIGREAGALSKFRDTLVIERPQPDEAAAWAASAEASSPAVRAQQAAYEIAQREIERNRAAHYPTLDAVASYNHNRNPVSPTASETNTQVVGLQLNLPIYAGGALRSREREAVALAERARNQADFTRRRAAQEARQAYLGVTSGIAQVKALEAALASSLLALDSNQTGMEVGVRINIDVLNAQAQVFATRRDLARARYDTLLAQLKLKATTGTLGEEDIRAINALLEK
jgi:outer membrane protein